MIVFVGDKPSAKNISRDVPFVGTQSYKRLLEWFWKLDVDVNDVVLINKDKAHQVMAANPTAKFVALGEEAYKTVTNVTVTFTTVMYPYMAPNEKVKTVTDLKFKCFKLPHPSGRNRKLNDKKWLDKELKKCKNWLKGD